jgi:lysine-specific histone demethylase 1B
MQRRKFIKNASWFAVGGLLLPSTLLQACRKASLEPEQPFKGKVVIVGAGIAGLYAGYLLQNKGIDFVILEATAMHGGRMGINTTFADYPIDTGAQWLHGRNSILGELVDATKTSVTNDTSEMYYWFNNALVKELPKDPFIFEEKNLPDVSFLEYAHQQGFGKEYDNIIEAIAGDQGAGAEQLSAYWNSKDEENWVAGDDDFKFRDTYFDFIDKNFAQPVVSRIRYNTVVTAIDYSTSQVTLTTKDATTFSADKVIVTIPIAQLKKNTIAFTPALPPAQTAAFDKFGMGPGMKVFLKFSEKFYKPVVYGGATCAAYADDSVGKNTNNNVMLAFVMGKQAQALHDIGSKTAITNALLAELDLMYAGKASATFIDSVVYDYTDRPYIGGAYGYSTLGMGTARVDAAKSVNNQLFFAGEAMNINGHHQTVHGAAESGYKALMDLLDL